MDVARVFTVTLNYIIAPPVEMVAPHCFLPPPDACARSRTGVPRAWRLRTSPGV